MAHSCNVLQYLRHPASLRRLQISSRHSGETPVSSTLKKRFVHPYTFFRPTPNPICLYKYWWGCEEKRTLLHCWWEWKLVQPLYKTLWEFLIKLKRELLYDPAIPLLGIYPDKTITWKDTCTLKFIATIYDSQDMKTIQMSINRCMNKEDAVCIHNTTQPQQRTK